LRLAILELGRLAHSRKRLDTWTRVGQQGTRSAIEGVAVGISTTATVVGTTISTRMRKPRLRPYLLIVLVACLAWGAAFLTPGSRYWDDWVLTHDTLPDTLALAQQLGVPWTGYVFVTLCAIGLWTFKVVALGTTIIVGCATYEISGRGLGLSSRERLLLAMLVVALPLNATRMMAVLDTYCWSLALFFVAWYLLVSKDPSSPGRIRYIFAALLFFASYTTGSLLVFTVLPVAHLAYLAIRRDVPWWEGSFRFMARFWYLFLAPVTFWIIRTVFLQPFGIYKGYNNVALKGGMSNPVTVDILGLCLTMVFAGLVFAFWVFAGHSTHTRIWRNLSLGALAVTTGAMGYFLMINRVSVASTALAVPVVLLLCAAILLVAAVLQSRFRGMFEGATGAESDDGNVTPILAVGLITLVLAMLPYLLVGKFPSFSEWEPRHQLLMPLGVAIIIVAAVRALSEMFPFSVVRLVSLGLIAGFTLVSLSVSLRLVADWRKQVQVIEALAKEPLVRNASVVVFSDEVPEFNYDARTFAFYEYNGWLIGAFGNESRLGIDRTSVRHFLNGNFQQHFGSATSRYGFGEYKRTNHRVLVQIDPIDGASWWTLLAGKPSVRLRVLPITSWTSLPR
jgi:hypothetical protein